MQVADIACPAWLGRYRFGPYRLDVAARRLLRRGRLVRLTPKAFQLLVLLVSQAPRIVEKRELLTTLWPDTNISESCLVVHIAQLRRQLGPSYILTWPGRGYQFVGGVAVAEAGAPRAVTQLELQPFAARRRQEQVLGDALLEALTLRLAALPGLVVSRGGAQAPRPLRGRPAWWRLSGSVQQGAGQWRVWLRLSDRAGRLLWVARFADQAAADPGLAEGIADEVAQRLHRLLGCLRVGH